MRKMSVGIVIVMSLTTVLWAGSLNPPAPPMAGTMKPLNDVEPRIAIHQSDIPLTITSAGSYYLAQNVTASNTAITVNTDDVTIDLNGFAMTGPVTGSYSGIYMGGRSNVEIRNGTIRYFSNGIFEESIAGEGHRVFNVRTVSNLKAGIHLIGNNHQVRNCTVSSTGVNAADNSIYGIFVGSGSTVAGNTITRTGSHAAATTYIYGIIANTGCVVTDNTVYNIGISAAGYVDGISTYSGCTVTGNNVHSNGTSTTIGTVRGIYAYGNGNTVSGNTAYNNGTSASGTVYGIYASAGNTVTGNTAYSNGGSSTGSYAIGIYAGTGSAVTGNTAYSNGISATGIVWGINLGGYNLVNNNTAYSNTATSGGNMNSAAGCVFGTNMAP